MARKTPEVNSSSTADMAFLLLCFFMMTTTMDQDWGLLRRLPPKPNPNHEQQNREVNRRNIIIVKINRSNKLLVGAKPMQVTDLRAEVKRIIKNQSNDPSLPAKQTITKEYKGKEYTFEMSEGVVSLQNDRGTRYEAYLEVQNELIGVFNELREEVAIQKFGVEYRNLDEEAQKIINEVVPQQISEAEPRDTKK